MDDNVGLSRKGFLRKVFALGGLFTSYGLLGGIVLRYLWPSRSDATQKIFITYTTDIPAGGTHTFSTPSGESYLLSNRVVDGKLEYFAFSNRCPHLGCKVLWDAEQNRFHCPCHGGIFNANGVATAGPPGKAKQSLKKGELVIVDTAIYALVKKT